MSILKRLDVLAPGQRGRIASISPCGNLCRSMMEMGLVIGSELKVIRLAPTGDLVEILLRGYSLALRNSTWESIPAKKDEMPNKLMRATGR